MVEQQAAVLSPETLIEEFQKNGVTHVVTIPDSETNYLYELMKEQAWLDIVPASREGETFGHRPGTDYRRQDSGLPHPEHGHDGVRRLHPGHGPGFRVPAGHGDRVPWLEPPRHYNRLGSPIHRAVPQRLSHQLLPGGTGCRQLPNLRGF